MLVIDRHSLLRSIRADMSDQVVGFTDYLSQGHRMNAVLLKQPCKRHLFADRLKRNLGFEIR